MKAKTKHARSASPPFLVTANEDQTSAAGFAVDFQDLCAQEMDRALGFHKASLDSAVRLHSCAIDIYNQASWFTPVLEALLDTAAKSFAQCMKLHAQCMEMHRSWPMLLAPYAMPYTEASSFLVQASATPEDLAHHMDIATGVRHASPGKTVARHAGHQVKRKEQSPDESMDSAIGARAA